MGPLDFCVVKVQTKGLPSVSSEYPDPGKFLQLGRKSAAVCHDILDLGFVFQLRETVAMYEQLSVYEETTYDQMAADNMNA